MITLYTPATGFPDLEAKIAYGLARIVNLTENKNKRIKKMLVTKERISTSLWV